MTSASPKAKSPPKKAIVFLLEGVLLPEPSEKEVTQASITKWLTAIRSFARSKKIPLYLVTGYTVEIATKKMADSGLNEFFDPQHIFSVTDAYLAGRDEIDRDRYVQRCAGDPECKDEYCRQVALKGLLSEKGWKPEQVVLVAHDYWFDGFYTRRFSMVDIAFVESALSSRGKPIPEKIGGVWYVSRSLKDIQKIVEGKAPAPNYNPLDTWVNITLTEELFGGKGLPTLKRVVIQRKKNGELGDVVRLGDDN